MIFTPLMPFRRSLAAHLQSIESSLLRRCRARMKAGALGGGASVLAAVTTAVNGCLTVGLVAQAMLIGASVLRRLMDK